MHTFDFHCRLENYFDGHDDSNLSCKSTFRCHVTFMVKLHVN